MDSTFNGPRAPEAVRRARAIRDEQGRLEGDHPQRPYFCRECGLEVLANAVPQDWYSLTRHGGDRGPMRRLGIYCSAACLGEGVARVQDVEYRLREQAAEREFVAFVAGREGEADG